MNISPSYFPHDNISCELIEKFSQTGSHITQEHLDASIFNTQLLKRFSPKIVLHLRDPRQVLLSWVYQMNQHKKDGNEILLYYVAPTPPSEYYNWSLSEQIDWNIDHFLPEVIAWMDRWLDFKQSQEQLNDGVQILLTTYDEFLDDEVSFYNRILDFYNITKSRFKYSPPEKNLSVHFRKGDVNEWRDTFTDEQKAKIAKVVPARLLEQFKWAP